MVYEDDIATFAFCRRQIDTESPSSLILKRLATDRLLCTPDNCDQLHIV